MTGREATACWNCGVGLSVCKGDCCGLCDHRTDRQRFLDGDAGREATAEEVRRRRACPSCGYGCGCCCHCSCQTPCPNPDENDDCNCLIACHGGHEPWECLNWSSRYDWWKEQRHA